LNGKQFFRKKKKKKKEGECNLIISKVVFFPEVRSCLAFTTGENNFADLSLRERERGGREKERERGRERERERERVVEKGRNDRSRNFI
jgi:hypothetical protein